MALSSFISCLTPVSALTPQALPAWQGPGRVDVLRLDQLHPLISGNKAFKLSGWLERFESGGYQRLLSFGGPWSNHLRALSGLAQSLGLPVTAIVRGYEHLPLTPTLEDCRDRGMQLVFASKKDYARRDDPDWQQALAEEYQALVIPEGGQGRAGEKGLAALAPLTEDYDEVWLAAGTGTTARGLAMHLRPGQTLVAVNAVADQGALRRRWQLLDWPCQWRLLDDYHGGGFGRCGPGLLQLIEHCDGEGLPLDPVYTAKLLAALHGEQQAGRLTHARRLLIHTGGLQGRRGVPGLTHP